MRDLSSLFLCQILSALITEKVTLPFNILESVRFLCSQGLHTFDVNTIILYIVKLLQRNCRNIIIFPCDCKAEF